MKKIKSIYYHNPTPIQLERTICWLLFKGFRFISSDELFYNFSQKCPIHEKLVYLSLDDAWRGNLLLVPIIEKYHVPITIFAPVEPVEKGNYWWEYVQRKEREKYKNLNYVDFCEAVSLLREKQTLVRSCMTSEELRKLAQHPLVSIQSHTLTHPILTVLPNELLRKELKDSKEKLESMIGCDVNYFSYPNGTYTAREVEAAREIYKMAFTTDLHDITNEDDILALPRIEITGRYQRDKLKFYNIWPFIRKICLLK